MTGILHLWRRARADTQGFESELAPHMERLYRLASRLTGGSPEETEELLQELLLRLHRHPSIRERNDPATWLNRVLYNLWVDLRRRRGARPPFEDVALDDPNTLLEPSSDDTEDPSELTERSLTVERLTAALEELAEAQRIPLLLHDVEGYTLGEISAMTGVATGTLKSRLSRGRSQLRRLLAGGTFGQRGAW